MRLCYPFLFFGFICVAQSKIAKGFILDEFTQQPIPYVNISILKSQIGTSSDENGSYTLKISQEDEAKDIILTSLGYKDSIMSVSNFINQKSFFLHPKVEQLQEVVISKKIDEKFLEVNPIERSDLCAGYGTRFENPWILALYFPYDETYKETDFLKIVKFHFGNFKNKKSKFRLRILTVDEDGLPHEDLLKESVIIELKKNQKISNVDIANYNLIFPRDGFYVALEWLYIPYNAEEVTFCLDAKCKKSEKRIRYNPIFSAICADENKYKVAMYNSGVWQFYAGSKYQDVKRWIPAISLTLSN